MPLTPGKSKKTIEKNFHEFKQGAIYRRAVNKFGKEKANKIMQAAVLSKAYPDKRKK